MPTSHPDLRLTRFAPADETTRAALHALFSVGIPAAGLAVVPGTSHTLLSEKPEVCVRLVRDFLTADPGAHPGADSACVRERPRTPRGGVRGRDAAVPAVV